MQSPVDIKTTLVCQDSQLMQRPLYWNYVPNNCKSLLNTGGGWKVTVEGQGSCLTGGPLANSYQLLQFHSHWGRCPNSGSEHTVDGRAYACELHLVHWNVDLYNSPEEATTSPQGLAVIGVFFEVGRKNRELSKITDILHEIRNKGDECPITEAINPASFFPDDLEYWTYEGSLTTPPYSESVTWIVFKKPIEISEKQLEILRFMNSSSAEICDDGYPVFKKVEDNCRVVQPMNGREIREAPY
ncbi:carbonic anhydrase 1 [Parasteatoda tepidariorum]|uniref:Carbonic anhydrase n=1 Tax=Parasteatoda tepidariorum TaxID=114398 RepID=A0A2L2YAC2_PARTP|nr:carbonic anhydrase 1 [Parasteatoda tepidariorum]XP_042910411.1 carbonic anhydrase 1 [Parasteatoda tepidariorum]